MKNTKRVWAWLALVLLLMSVATLAVSAEGETAATADNGVSIKAVAAGAVLGIVALAGVVGMTLIIRKALDGTTRQPEADAKIRSSMMLGLVFVETLIIYALIVAILIVFVL